MSKTTKFVFCDDLDAPELLIIMDDRWAAENDFEIRATPGISFPQNAHRLRSGDILLIPEPEDRLMFQLKWA